MMKRKRTMISARSEEIDKILPEDVPVVMPSLPMELVVNTPQQFKAMGDDTRSRILDIIRHQPATAKQIADRLKIAPGTIGHHLQVLEAAGLAMVVARRLTHGIVAKYYTRTARIFKFDYAPDVRGSSSVGLDIVTKLRDEMAESLITYGEEMTCDVSFPHARLSEERAKLYRERLSALLHDFLQEPGDASGQVYGLGMTLFLSPAYMQDKLDINAAETAKPTSPSMDEEIQ